METCGGVACFIISNHPSLSTKGFSEILIQGTSGVELSAGLHWYLKHWCLIHISWEKTGGLQLSSLPKVGSLPHVPSAGILIHMHGGVGKDGRRKLIGWFSKGSTYHLLSMGKKQFGRKFLSDTFDENTPPVDDPKYISSLGSAIYKGMQSGDDDAIWLMQGWLFSYDPFWKPPQMKALLHSVPIGRMVVLDLFAEVKPIWVKSKQFYGVPYIWCMLHNFAGNIEMYGILDAIALGPIEARTSENSTMVGVGMSMEGIEQNPVVYDLMSEMAFHHKPVDVKIWVDLYATRRYGRSVPALQDAWQILYHTLYNCTDGAYDKNRDVIVAFPDVDPSVILIPEIFEERKLVHFSRQLSEREPLKETANSYDQPHLWYSTADVTRALVLFLENGYDVSDSQTFRYDLVDLTRQALAKYANKVFLKIIEGYQLSNLKQVTIYSQHFLDLMKELDLLLSCHDGFLLGPWLESAKRLARDPEQEQQFEWNARTQVTMWFDNTETEASLLRDYGNKY
ncbi:alpha-N-acetylglucosaminidase-like isoform X3 [Musa acuminata AAA Group]|uniref:alpha-N-acetylglucosaminidase-like isoform X3 n=1 Tax=Musa acuminata AAA Group TaxID=214697 RepID=UPI0031D4016F